jgi:exosortase/archaeosortase family protein
MKIAQQILSMKPALLFLIKLVVIYVVLDMLFWGYIGVSDPHGGYYFPVLDYVNALEIVLTFLLYPVKYLFELFGYTIDIHFYSDMYRDGASIGAKGFFKLQVAFPCLGFLIMIAFTSLMLAYPGYKKWVFIPLGLLFIQCINMLRIIGIILCLLNRPDTMSGKEVAELSHTYFNFAVYTVIGLYFYWWVKRYGESVVSEQEKVPRS